MKALILAGALLALSGCAAIKAEHVADDDATCASQGLQAGTPGYAQCRQWAADRRAQAFASMGTMTAPNYIQPRRQPTSTDCMWMGDILHCASN